MFVGWGSRPYFSEYSASGLIEMITPKGGLSIKPSEEGKISVTSAAEGDAAVRQLLKEGISGIRTYYEGRYWSTPKTSS